jgi:hypothetical protein
VDRFITEINNNKISEQNVRQVTGKIGREKREIPEQCNQTEISSLK